MIDLLIVFTCTAATTLFLIFLKGGGDGGDM